MQLTLSFDSGETSLYVHQFIVEEAMSTPFSVKVVARSLNPSIDLSTIVGSPARFAIESDPSMAHLVPRTFIWSGLCVAMVERETPDPTLSMLTVDDWIAAGKPSLSLLPSNTLTTYELTITPTLWKLGQNKRARLFQHVSIPDIVDTILASYQIQPVWQLDRPSYPKLELRTQYFETDLDFVSRLLEEAGIAYFFVHEGDADKGESQLVLDERPQVHEPRKPPLIYRESVTMAQHVEFLTEVRFSNEVRTAKYSYRDFDFRKPDTANVPTASVDVASENGFQRLDYRVTQSLAEGGTPDKPGNLKKLQDFGIEQARGVADEALKQTESFAVAKFDFLTSNDPNAQNPELSFKNLYTPTELDLIEKADQIIFGGGTTPVADDKGVARFQERQSSKSAQVTLDSIRATRWQVTYATSVLDLSPGTVFTVVDHPNILLSHDQKLLAIEARIEGEDSKFTSVHGQAVFAAVQYRPPQKTPKPRVSGVQSATVKGPAAPPAPPVSPTALPTITREQIFPENHEIYVDEFGRVRVQFIWDSEAHSDSTSVWMRVSQGWAGQSFGMITIPRIDQEVLVAFIDGDPDNPIIVGRVYNGIRNVPHSLAENKTVSTWKTQSSPGGGNFNEIRLEDAKDREMVYVQAAKDYVQLTKSDDRRVVGQHRAAVIKQMDAEIVGQDQTTVVGAKKTDVVYGNEVGIIGGDRIDLVGMNETKLVGEKFSVRVARGLPTTVREGLDGLKGKDDKKGPLAPFFADSLVPTLGQIPARPLNGVAAVIARMAAAPMNFINAGKGAVRKLIVDPLERGVKRQIPTGLQAIALSPINGVIERTVDGAGDRLDKKLGSPFKTLVDRVQELTNPVAGWGRRLSEGPISVLPELLPEPLRKIVASAYKEVPHVKPGSGANDPTEIGPPPTELSVAQDHIELTTGQASIILDGPNITIIAKGSVRIQADKNILVDSQTGSISLAAEVDLVAGAKHELHLIADEKASLVSTGGDVIIKGGPNVQINPPDDPDADLEQR